MSSSPKSIQLLLKPREAAKALAISDSLLWKMTKAGRIPSKRIGRCLRYDLLELQNWLATAC
jgi:excisionase family DNA binding protein